MPRQSDTQRIDSELSQLREDLERLRAQVAHANRAGHPFIHTDHPHVVRMEGVHGGRPIILGTGVSVQTIIEQLRLGCQPEQLVEEWGGVLTLAQVYDALSYYHEHTNEIEQYIAENRAALAQGPWTTDRV